MPGLGRSPYFDEQSRAYPVRAMFTPAPAVRRKRIWTPRFEPLDQGEEGECVAFANSSELAATPWRHTVTNESARALFQAIRVTDQAMGNHFPEGASVLAGAKTCQAQGLIDSYRWAFGIDDVIETLLRRGPIILGIDWFESMYTTEEGGLVRIGGAHVGGHGIMANGFWPNHPLFGDVVAWINTWGLKYGINGMGLIKVADLKWLLHERRGEACIFVDARPKPLRPTA